MCLGSEEVRINDKKRRFDSGVKRGDPVSNLAFDSYSSVHTLTLQHQLERRVSYL